METTKINLKKCKLLGEGMEGKVFAVDNQKAAKIFLTKTPNKINKIKLLNKKVIDNFYFPKQLLLNKADKPIGYTMDLVLNKKHPNMNVALQNAKDLKEKIKYFKQLENNLKKAHQEGIIIGDFNLENFIPTSKGLAMIDTDNYAINGYELDTMTMYYYIYSEKISKELSSNLDKFSFTYKMLEKILSVSIFYYDLYENEIFNLIKSLDLPPHLIELVLKQISYSKDKVYFGDTLDEFANYGKYILQK